MKELSQTQIVMIIAILEHGCEFNMLSNCLPEFWIEFTVSIVNRDIKTHKDFWEEKNIVSITSKIENDLIQDILKEEVSKKEKKCCPMYWIIETLKILEYNIPEELEDFEKQHTKNPE